MKDDQTEAAQDLLKAGLAEAQTTVRAYDTKAQIVGVGYIFALGVVGRVDGLVPQAENFGLVAFLVTWVIVIAPILMFGHVLYPTRKTAPRAEATKRDGIQHLLYLDPKLKSSVSEVREAALKADPIKELSFELITVSTLREIKRRRFLRGLFLSAFSFSMIFVAQLSRVL